MRPGRAARRGALAGALAAALLCACATPPPRDAPARDSQPTDAGRDRAADAFAQAACAALDAAATPLLRLTRVQYRNSVADLLGLESVPELALPPDPSPVGLARGEHVSGLLAERYFSAAEQLAALAAQDLDRLLACDRGREGDDACATRFVTAFGRRAYRRPLGEREHAALSALYAQARADFDFGAGIEAVVQALLASPGFLYARYAAHGELRGYGVAARLASFLWNGPPDDALLDSAAASELESAAGVATQARRMLDDPRAARGLRDFYREWLALDAFGAPAALAKDPSVYPELDADLARDLHASLELFLDEALASEHAISALLLGGFDYRNARLAAVYGPAQLRGDDLQRVTPDARTYTGLLTHPALLALLGKPNQSDPVQRGRFVREQLLCQSLPQPPSELILAAPDPDPARSTRERFADHAAEPLCASCHRLLDPIGFGLEHFDGQGRHRDTDQGARVNAEGELSATLDADGAFDGALELSAQLEGSADVYACVAQQLLRRALPGSDPAPGCVDDLGQAFAASGGDLRALRLAVVQSDAFLGRASGAEGAP